MPVSKKFLANSFAKFYVRREPSSRRTSSRRTLVRSGCNFFPRTNFLANRSPVSGGVRANSGEPGRTRANSAELRRTFGVLLRTFAGVRRSVGVGEPMANSRGVRSSSPEFARVRGERQFAGYTAPPLNDACERALGLVTRFNTHITILFTSLKFDY